MDSALHTSAKMPRRFLLTAQHPILTVRVPKIESGSRSGTLRPFPFSAMPTLLRRACVPLLLLVAGVARGGGTAPRFTGSPPVQVWPIEEHGGAAINWRVLVHPRTGFIYAANNNGVLEFDGVRWRVIP